MNLLPEIPTTVRGADDRSGVALPLVVALLSQKQESSLQTSLLRKREYLKELVLQQVAYHKLLRRNEALAGSVPEERRIPLPFIVLSTSDQTTIHLEMDTPDRCDATGPRALSLMSRRRCI